MGRYFVEIAFDGGAYHGWQRQKNAHTVQAEIEDALGKIYHKENPEGERIAISGQGRTDAGVHAKQFYFHFDAAEFNEEHAFRLDRILPNDIAILSHKLVHEKAHTRFDATARSYEYHIHLRKEPFYKNSMRSWWPLNVEAMNEAAALLIGIKDFSSFEKVGGGNKHSNCDLTRAEWVFLEDHRICFYVTANRFLRNMVRAIVGTLLKVGEGKIQPHDIVEIIEQKHRSASGSSVPANGLYLSAVKYPFDLT